MTPLKQQMSSTDTIFNKKGDYTIAVIDILAICCYLFIENGISIS